MDAGSGHLSEHRSDCGLLHDSPCECKAKGASGGPITEQDIVWIPCVPLPLLGWRTDRCSCGKRFRGKGRRAAYELHYRRAHQRSDPSPNQPQMGVPREEAKRIYAEVNADSVGTTSDRVKRG